MSNSPFIDDLYQYSWQRPSPNLESVFYSKIGAFKFIRDYYIRGRIPIKMIKTNYRTTMFSHIDYREAKKVKSNKLNLTLYKNAILLEEKGWLYVKS